MAALESTGFVRFEPPLTNASFCNRNTLCPAKPSRAISSPTSSQKARRPAATLSRSRYQAEADRNTATSKGLQRALAVSDDELDDDLPSLEELSRTALRPKISTEASKTASTAQRLEQPALDGAGLRVDRTQPGLGRRQGDSRDQPMMLDDDEADEAEEGNSGDVDTRRIRWDASPQNTLATLELASGPTKSVDTSGPWYDVEEGCYIEERAPGLGPCEKQGVHSAHTQAQPQTLPQPFTPLQDQTNQQGVGSITRSTSVESAVHSLPKPFDSGDNGWTDDSVAELEIELGMALKEQGNSPSASTPRSAKPSHLQIDQEHDQSGTGNVRLEELILRTPLRSQDQGDEPQEQHQRQEVVVGSPVDSSRSTRGSTQDSIILSDNESVGAESETDYSNLDVDLTAKGDSHSLYIADSDLADDANTRSTKRSRQSRALATAPDQERELRNIDLEMVDDGSTDNSNDGDYADESDAAGSKIGGRPRSRKRVRQTKDTKDNDVAAPSTHSLNVSYQVTAATSSGSMQESEEIPIHGYLTLKTIESKVVYCLTFSQELLPKPNGTSQRQGIARSDSSSSDRRDSERSPVQGRDMSTPTRNSRFSREEDELLLQLKGEGLSWDVISDRFPERSKGTLQVHFSTKLKPRSETSKETKKRRRSG